MEWTTINKNRTKCGEYIRWVTAVLGAKRVTWVLTYACSDTSLAILGIFSVCINELDVKVNSTLVTLADDKVGRVQHKSGQKKNKQLSKEIRHIVGKYKWDLVSQMQANTFEGQ